METTDLAVWLRPHCAPDKDKNGVQRPERRAVLITGAPARRNARDEYATIELHERDPADAAREIQGAIADYLSADPTFIEIREKGEPGHKAIKRIEPGADAPAPAAPILDVNTAIGALVSGITSSNSVLVGRVNHLETALDHSIDKRIELAERAAQAETYILGEQAKAEWIAEHGGGDFADSAKMLAELANSDMGRALAAKILGHKPPAKPTAEEKAAAEKKAPDPGLRADKLIAAVTALLEAHPTVITMQRLLALRDIGKKVKQIAKADPELAPWVAAADAADAAA